MRPTLPESWKWCHLDDVATVQTGLALGKKDLKDAVERPYLRVANVQDGYFDLREVKTVRVERSKVARHSLRYGDVLLTEGGDFDKLGRGHIWRDEVAECLHQNHVFAVRPDDSVLLPEYLSAITSGPWGRAYFLGCSKQSTNLASINSTQVKEMPLPLPPLDEQRQIVDRLAQFDGASTCLKELTEHRRRRLRGLMQQLLTGRRRLPAFAGEAWTEVPISSVMREDDRPVEWNDDELYELVSVRRWAGGVYTRDQLYGRDIKVKKLKRIKSGDVLISHIQSAYGAMAMVSDDHDGHCVSDLYTVLVPQDASRCDLRFFAWLCRTKWMWHQALVASNGFKAERLRINFDPASFLKLMIDMPTSLDEQRAIADILDTAQREIELLEQLREQIQLQKRGLMQKLLTGEIRVPTEANA